LFIRRNGKIEIEVNAETKGPIVTTSADGFLTCVTWSPGMGDPSWSKLPMEEVLVNLVESLEQLSYCIGRLTPSPQIPGEFLLEQTLANLGCLVFLASAFFQEEG
jgi:hypothetical protein